MKQFVLLFCVMLQFLRCSIAQADSFAASSSNFREAEKVIVAIDANGLSVSELQLSAKDDSVFFFNQTSDSLLSLEIDFGKNRLHCWSPNLEVTADGIMRTKEPISPRDFAVVCFPEAADYPFTVKGLGGKRELKGKVIVR